MWQALIEWDRATFIAINSGMQSPFLDSVMPPISDLGLGHMQALAILLLAILVGAKKREIRGSRLLPDAWSAIARRKGWVAPLLAAFALSGISSTVIKNSVERDRPSWFYLHEHEAGRHQDVKVQVIEGRRPLRVRGFLSGHTATSVALATAFTLVARRRRWVRGWAAASWTIALLVSFSRIYTADHWPLDVLAGAALGFLCGIAGVWLTRGSEMENYMVREKPTGSAEFELDRSA